MVSTKGLKLIGKGAFSRVYDAGDCVLIKSNDYAKEAFSIGLMPSGANWPACEKLEHGEVSLYKMPKYEKFIRKAQLSQEQYAIYKALKKLIDANMSWNNDYFFWVNLFNKDNTLPPAIREQICEALDGLANYGTDIQIEISRRNVAVLNGKLILLDLFFFSSLLKQNRSK